MKHLDFRLSECSDTLVKAFTSSLEYEHQPALIVISAPVCGGWLILSWHPFRKCVWAIKRRRLGDLSLAFKEVFNYAWNFCSKLHYEEIKKNLKSDWCFCARIPKGFRRCRLGLGSFSRLLEFLFIFFYGILCFLTNLFLGIPRIFSAYQLIHLRRNIHIHRVQKTQRSCRNMNITTSGYNTISQLFEVWFKIYHRRLRQTISSNPWTNSPFFSVSLSLSHSLSFFLVVTLCPSKLVHIRDKHILVEFKCVEVKWTRYFLNWNWYPQTFRYVAP